MSEPKELLADERQAVKDYAEGISSAKSRGDVQAVKTLKHIQNEERGHANELSNLIQGKKMDTEKKVPHAGHGFTRTVIEHHDDGSHTLEHAHEDGPHKDLKYAVADLDSMHDGLEDHLGEPNDGEEAEDSKHPSHSELLEEIEELIKKLAKEEKAEGE